MVTKLRARLHPFDLLPLVVPLLYAVLLGGLVGVAPGLTDQTIHKIYTSAFEIDQVDIDCVSAGTLRVCDTEVAGRTLHIEVDTEIVLVGPCHASYAGEQLACAKQSQYGQSSPTVIVTGLLGFLSEDDIAAMRDRVPWWHPLVEDWESALLPVPLALAALVFLIALFEPSHGGRRLLPPAGLVAVVAIGVWFVTAAIAVFAVPADRPNPVAWVPMLAVHVGSIVAATYLAWAFAEFGPRPGVLNRIWYVAVITLTTGFLASAGLLYVAVFSGFPD
ncbi:hypothetical protein GCM10022243_19070 [Saccharothrix violaceirubra]|uniref:Uncharacterized protein n=1 Tax=Saccharothrix violaceirubra TaxID=413306 RepID=A0A7W7T250_9PSEU|nr:hypothetical protein [Saccharothrix violaceirubra]MBB4965185.1 hypothetical protein [Saccharothrix violaceirubra]